MAEITRLQVIDLRDKGVITPERAVDWLAILDKGGILDVSQKLADQAAAPESLLPIGVTVSGDNEIEIDFRQVTREGLLQLNQAGVLEPQQTTDLLAKAREVQARPESIGGKLVSAARAAFDPTDPRGVINIGPVPVKAGLAAAGLSLALPGAAVTAAPGLAVPTSAGGVLPSAVPATATALTGAAGRVAGTAGRLTGINPRSIPRLLATGAVGAGAGLAVSGALSGGGPPDEVEDVIPEAQGESEAERVAREALEAGATPDEASAEAKRITGVDVKYITRKVKRFNPSTGRIEEIDSIIPIITDTQIDPITGQPVTTQSAGAPFFPQLAQSKFQLEQTEQERKVALEEERFGIGQEEKARKIALEAERFGIGQERLDQETLSRERSDLLRSLPQLTQFFSMLADPRTANLLRITAARAGGQETVGGLGLPEQLGALFGLEPGQELPSGVQGREAGGPAGGFLGSIGKILGEASGFQTPQLQSQLTPGTARGFSQEELGAAQAALIGSGTTLEEQQRIARRSALPGGSLVRSR